MNVPTHFLTNKVNRLFLVLSGLFITNTLVAEFIGVKIFSLEKTLGFDSFDWTLFGTEGLGFNLTAGVLLWPIVFVMTDVINEYFGHKGVRFLSFMAVGLILFAFVIVYGAIWLSPNAWWQYESGKLNGGQIVDMNQAFQKIFGQGLWIIVGSLIAFLIGQIVDVLVFHRIRRWTGESKVWLRATGSTLVSQWIDSYVVLLVAFWIGADWDLTRVLAIGTVNYIYKFVVAIALTPAIYASHKVIDSYLGESLAVQLKSQAAE